MSLAIVPCNTRCLNMGDVAMLQVAVARVREWGRWEDVRVFTSDPQALLRYCPGVTPVVLPDHPAWCADRYLGGRLHTWLAERRSGELSDASSHRADQPDRLAEAYVRLACRFPRLREWLLAARTALRADERESFQTFVDTIAGARLVVISGAGGIADHFHDYANLALLALQCAQRRGIPTAILGHG